MIKVAINGFGRIGRLVFRLMEEDNDFEVVAINDLTDPEQLAYLLKYDTSHRTYLKEDITYDENHIIVKGRKIRIYSEMDPNNLPWKELQIDEVFECTGKFTDKEKAMAHINAGAKKVIISAPAKDEAKTIVYGVNENTLTSKDKIISAASCTTNCLAPVINLLNKNYKVISGFMTTVHAITNDQETLDIPHKKGIESRRGRAASLNIIPTSTGAASQIGKVIPELKGKLDGLAYRVPVGDGSLIDLTVLVEKSPTVEKINKMFKDNQSDTLKIVNVPLVSSDIIGTDNGAVIDALLTKVIKEDEKTMIKIAAWYDNEWGYTAQMLRVAASWVK